MKIRKWPYGFLDSFWSHYSGESYEYLPPDITDDNELAGSVEYVLAVSGLSDREKEMLRLRFQSGKTYREIGCQYNISTVTVSDHINTSLRKLFRCSKYKQILSEGVAAYARRTACLKRDEEIEKIVEERVLKARLSDGRYWANKHCPPEDLKDLPVYHPAKRNSTISTRKQTQTKPVDTHIVDLPLSNRIFYALSRAGISNVSDILKRKDKDDILSIRNLGEKSYEDLMSILEKNGYDVKHLRI